ncbi:hypothetical protein AB0L26_07475 [Streptomyces nondiastaticus]|uniref:hypothetical protein n=1 Tax=Streptomyces nondiastaticus TaxID=3154512 RepID=UPI0034132718
MKAIHVNSTLPSVPYLGRLKGPDGYQVEDFELLTTILSAAAWRRFNGPVKLYTDHVGEAYYRRLGMTELWDGGVDTEVLESLPASISHDVFWTAGRVAALQAETAPFASLDTDLVVWGPIGALITSDFMALHSEPLHHGVYKPRSELSTPPGYVWEEWDWDALPCNASLTYYAEDRLTKVFHAKAMEFIVGNPIRREAEARLPVHDVFVAQRLLPMCALRLGVRPAYFLDWPRPEHNSETMTGGGRNQLVTHVWAYKGALKSDQDLREAFCRRCVARIRADYPELVGMLRHMPGIRRYLS